MTESTHVTTTAQIGPYRILETLGEGGMGTVYLAEQSQPVKRRVALKLIKLGMDSKAVVARFEQERQALALMQHDGIAKVHDCGTSERGQPFFVMELVKGVPLTSYCDQNKLSLPERIALMQQVCDAVQHAHQKGVVHRDLKPGNVLVVEEAGKPRIKIIDFGLAKAMGQKLVEATLFTEAGQVVGTPEYMAPEQADPTNQDIDTRADVYSLGVMLYEVLTGQLPFNATELRKAGLLEMQRVLKEIEAPRPSTKLSSVLESAAAIAEQRRTSPAALSKALKNDLDWLVLKALEKDRARRYETANALKMDLQRYLDHEPLAAGPPSATYRLKKLVRRYRSQVIAGAAVLGTAVAGALVAVKFAVDAHDSETLATHRAEENARLAEEKSEIAAAETKAKEDAERNGIEARRLADFLGAKMREYDQLAGVVLCDRAIAAEQDLWPPWPHKVPAMEEWLTKHAALLLALREPIQKTIDRLRSMAMPQTEDERVADQRSHPRFVEWQRLQKKVEALRKDELTAADREKATVALHAAEKELTALTAVVGERRTWRFMNVSQRADMQPEAMAFLHDTLCSLLRRIDGLEKNEKPSVEQRLLWAKQVRDLTLAHPNAKHTWAAVRAAIAANPKYAGQSIELRDDDVMGLVPIGENPKTCLWEFYELVSAWDGKQDPRTIAIPTHAANGSIDINGDTGIVFVLLPGGTLTMGAQHEDPSAPNYDPLAFGDEGPCHSVTLDPFFLGKWELTQGQWARLWGLHELFGGRDGTTTSTHPATAVDWTMCERVLRQQRLVLPTEARWEYGCRAGSSTPWSCREDELRFHANVADASLAGDRRKTVREIWSDGFAEHAPVGSFLPNSFGLYDMHGNVCEWCLDGFSHYQATVRPGDGLRKTDNPPARVCRGGSWYDPRRECRSSHRYDTYSTSTRFNDLGLRAARNLE